MQPVDVRALLSCEKYPFFVSATFASFSDAIIRSTGSMPRLLRNLVRAIDKNDDKAMVRKKIDRFEVTMVSTFIEIAETKWLVHIPAKDEAAALQSILHILQGKQKFSPEIKNLHDYGLVHHNVSSGIVYPTSRLAESALHRLYSDRIVALGTALSTERNQAMKACNFEGQVRALVHR